MATVSINPIKSLQKLSTFHLLCNITKIKCAGWRNFHADDIVWYQSDCQNNILWFLKYTLWIQFQDTLNPVSNMSHSVDIISIVYLLTPWSGVLLERLNGFQLAMKFPAFCGTWRFITPFTSAHYLSLPCVSSTQSKPPHPTSWRSILILSSHLWLGLPSGLFPY